ncbi:hypothetical protein H5410_010363 [Solanum commersonii]|uniref:Uncharacterized protein n=1 Tax=Solanum commersonii TaxID=4109 RepID=A0A9J6AL54_SOLCO|nr:hypothetical protein H5410_010363 [Solanum commersonii]
MAKCHTIKTIDRSFRDIMDVNQSFGGKAMRKSTSRHMQASVDPVLSKARLKRAKVLKQGSKRVERFALLYVHFSVVIKLLRQTFTCQ